MPESTFEIFLEEQRRNTGNRARFSIWRVWVMRVGRNKPWRDDTFTERRLAVDRFNLYRRTMNTPDAIEKKTRAALDRL